MIIPKKSECNVHSYNKDIVSFCKCECPDLIKQLMMTMMMRLMNVLSQRETIAREMQATLDDATEAWGVQVERVEVTKKITFGEIIRIHLKL